MVRKGHWSVQGETNLAIKFKLLACKKPHFSMLQNQIGSISHYFKAFLLNLCWWVKSFDRIGWRYSLNVADARLNVADTRINFEWDKLLCEVAYICFPTTLWQHSLQQTNKKILLLLVKSLSNLGNRTTNKLQIVNRREMRDPSSVKSDLAKGCGIPFSAILNQLHLQMQNWIQSKKI